MRAPGRVLDVELGGPDPTSDRAIDVADANTLWCLFRLDGVPQSIQQFDVSHASSVSVSEICASYAGSADGMPAIPRDDQPLGKITVVICTRDRPAGLAKTLLSLTKQTDDDFDVLVVDNAPSNSDAQAVVLGSGLPHCRYVMEPVPGLSHARNRGLAEVDGEFVGWLDDDEVADPSWMYWIKQGFRHSSDPDAVCGLMLPAELETQAQVLFEQYGGFNKGRDLEPTVLRAKSPTVRSPLYPLPGFGAGGNMAFQVAALRRVGGFDRYLGAGTLTHGGEETKALALILREGGNVLHWPPAVTWHYHRREMEALEKQFFGYSAGLSAFYMSMLKSHPRTVVDIVRLVPQGLKDFFSSSGDDRGASLPDDFPAALLRASRRGLLRGAWHYLREVARQRKRTVA
jgi:glycosyltransferase involved in cell wall biosynthesis